MIIPYSKRSITRMDSRDHKRKPGSTEEYPNAKAVSLLRIQTRVLLTNLADYEEGSEAGDSIHGLPTRMFLG